MVKKIDFHIHTISSNKDYEFTYSSDWIQHYVKQASLDAIAITNHDLFDIDNFNKVKQDLPNITVFPGIELSLEDGHVNIIFSEKNIEHLKNFSEWLIKQDENKKLLIEDYCKNMKCWEDAIYIFEMGKSNSLSVPTIIENSSATVVGGVSNQLKFQALYNQDNLITPVLFSDAHAAKDDLEKERNDIDLLKMKNTYLQIDNCTFTEIKNCMANKKGINTNKDNLSNIIEIQEHNVSTGMNLIVGKRGTGKSRFLNLIKKQYDPEDYYAIDQFETSQADKYIEKQRKVQGNSSFNRWKRQYETQFNAIEEYLNRDDHEFDGKVEQYLDSLKNFATDNAKSRSKSKFRLNKESNFEMIPTQNLESYITKIEQLLKSNDLWTLLNNSHEKRKVFIESYNELRNMFINKQQQNQIKSEVNKILESVKKTVQLKTGITPIKNCDFSPIIQKTHIEKEIVNFMQNIINEQELTREQIYDYQIVVKISPFQNASQFKNDISTPDAVKDDIIIPYRKKEYIKFLKNLKNKSFFKISNLADYFVHLNVELLDSDGTPASGGQAVGFALMMRLEESKSYPIVLIDEPEASLDNTYIRDELIPALKNLATYSTIFLVTHNSTLGALINPDYLIITTKNNKNDYQVLTGEFSSNLISNNYGSSENSYDKFVEAMESSIETYQKKGETYENLRTK